MPRSSPPIAAETLEAPYAVGPFAIREGGLVGEDADGRLVPIEKAVRFVGVAKESHQGNAAQESSRVEASPVGSFVFAFVGWAPSFADVGRKVWAFSQGEVAGAPFKTEHLVGKVEAVAKTPDGKPGVVVGIDANVGLAD